MASDSLLNVIAGLVKRESRIAKDEALKAKEALKAQQEEEDEEEDEEEPVAQGKPVAGYDGDDAEGDSEEDEDEAPVGDQDNPETEPEPEAEPAPEPEGEPEGEEEPEDDGTGDTKPNGPDPALVQQVADIVIAQITKAAEKAKEESGEVKLSGKKSKIDTKPKLEQEIRTGKMNFKEAIRMSVTGTHLTEGYEEAVLDILEDEQIDGPLGYEPFFEKGKLYVEKGSEKKAAKVLKQSKEINKVPKIIGETTEFTEYADLEELKQKYEILATTEAVDVDGRRRGFKEALRRLTYEKIQQLKKEGAAEFMAAASAAKREGKKKFKFGGKEYPVTIKVDIPLKGESVKKKLKTESIDEELEEAVIVEVEKRIKTVQEVGIGDVALGLGAAGGAWALKKAWDKFGFGVTKKQRAKRAQKKIDKADEKQKDKEALAKADTLGKDKDEEGNLKNQGDAQEYKDKTGKAPDGWKTSPEDSPGKGSVWTNDDDSKWEAEKADKKSAADAKAAADKEKGDAKAAKAKEKKIAKDKETGQANKAQRDKRADPHKKTGKMLDLSPDEKKKRLDALRKKRGGGAKPSSVGKTTGKDTSGADKLLRRNSFYVSAIEELFDLNEEVRSQLLEELVLEETMSLEESNELQAIMALDDIGIKADINRKGQVTVKKKDLKKAEKALSKSFRKGGAPKLVGESVKRSAFEVVSEARTRSQQKRPDWEPEKSEPKVS